MPMTWLSVSYEEKENWHRYCLLPGSCQSFYALSKPGPGLGPAKVPGVRKGGLNMLSLPGASTDNLSIFSTILIGYTTLRLLHMQSSFWLFSYRMHG